MGQHGFTGIDVGRAPALAESLARWQIDAEAIADLIRQGERGSDLSSGTLPALDEIGNLGTAMAAAINDAVATATAFQIDLAPIVDPRLSIFLDLPVGTPYNPLLADEAITRGETYRQTIIRRELYDLFARPLSEWTPSDAWKAARLRLEYSAIDPSTDGDLGGTLTTEIRTPFRSDGETSFDQGLGVVTHALADTADSGEIHVDEFQAIFHDNGKVTLVLPGVIDLSSPHLGYDPASRSARDVDQEALRSSFSSDVDDNGYAQLVREWVRRHVTSGAIPQGTEVLIVGHSFGADTALDLASDPTFNGDLVTITHVVPAAYHSEPQLDDVVNGTQVGVLQNIYDLPVLAEGLGYDAFTPGSSGGTGGAVRIAVEGLEGAGGLGATAANGLGWLGEQVVEHAADRVGIDIDVDIPDLDTDIEILGDYVGVVPDVGFIAEFEGGFEGVGHHQNNYIDFLDDADLDPTIAEFIDEIGDAGYGDDGVSVTVDVSIPLDPAPEPSDGLGFPIPTPFPFPPNPLIPIIDPWIDDVLGPLVGDG